MKLRFKLGLALWAMLSLLGCASTSVPQIPPATSQPMEETITVQEDGWYSTKEEVAEYLETYGHLPENYITKKEAQALGWDNAKGNLWDVAEGKSATAKVCFPTLTAGLGMNATLIIKVVIGERNALSFPMTV